MHNFAASRERWRTCGPPRASCRRIGDHPIDLTLLPGQLQSLFDPLPDVVFFVKDAECRYAHVNQTLIQRLGLRRREDIIGKSVLELYPASLSTTYIMQDRRVLDGEVIENLLELQL